MIQNYISVEYDTTFYGNTLFPNTEHATDRDTCQQIIRWFYALCIGNTYRLGAKRMG